MRRCNIKNRKAAAIAYDPGDIAPRIVASGRGREAERIVQLAKDAGIEVIEDPVLSVLLDAELKEGDFIPPWCWDMVAKILAFVLTKERK